MTAGAAHVTGTAFNPTAALQGASSTEVYDLLHLHLAPEFEFFSTAGAAHAVGVAVGPTAALHGAGGSQRTARHAHSRWQR